MEPKKMGRPTTPEYRKKILRYSKIEDTLKPVIESLKDESDKLVLLKALEKLQA